VLGNDDIIRLEAELLSALRQSQDDIGANSELRFLELLHAGVHRVRFAVDEKDAEGPASVGSRGVRTDIPAIRLHFGLT
jgi:hypothetical protein